MAAELLPDPTPFIVEAYRRALRRFFEHAGGGRLTVAAAATLLGAYDLTSLRDAFERLVAEHYLLRVVYAEGVLYVRPGGRRRLVRYIL